MSNEDEALEYRLSNVSVEDDSLQLDWIDVVNPLFLGGLFVASYYLEDFLQKPLVFFLKLRLTLATSTFVAVAINSEDFVDPLLFKKG